MWKDEYILRVLKELERDRKSPTGRNKVDIYVYDLLEESGLNKSDFYEILFSINRVINDNIVLYLK